MLFLSAYGCLSHKADRLDLRKDRTLQGRRWPEHVTIRSTNQQTAEDQPPVYGLSAIFQHGCMNAKTNTSHIFPHCILFTISPYYWTGWACPKSNTLFYIVWKPSNCLTSWLNLWPLMSLFVDRRCSSRLAPGYFETDVRYQFKKHSGQQSSSVSVILKQFCSAVLLQLVDGWPLHI